MWESGLRSLSNLLIFKKKTKPINEHFTGYKLNEIKMTNTYKQWMKAKTFTI